MSKTMPLGRNLLLAGFVAVGVAAAWYALSTWFVGIVESAMQRHDPYENINVTGDGEPVIVRTSEGGGTTQSILALDGTIKNITSQDLLYFNLIEGPEKSPRAYNVVPWTLRI